MPLTTPEILCVGIATLDQVFYVSDLPAGPGKSVAKGYRRFGGGIAANAAVALSRLGASVDLWTCLGDDETGDWIAADLRDANVNLHVQTQIGAVSPQSAVFVSADGDRSLVNHRSRDLFSPPADLPDFSRYDAVLCDTRWPQAAEAALTSGIPVRMLDADQGLPGNARTLVEASSHVIFAKAGLDELTGGDLAAAASGNFVAVTDGANGTRTLNGTVPAYPVDAVDSNGAGDVFHAAATYALATGAADADALDFASAAAALKCLSTGGRASFPTLAAVQRFHAERKT